MGTHIYIKRAKNIRVLGTGAFCLFLLLNFLTIFPIVKHTDEAEAAYTPSTSTVTITSASNIASVDITPNSAAGTFVSSATAGSEVTFGVTTDNLTGYTIAVAARSGDTSGQLTNASYGDTIDSISTITTESDFSTGAAATYSNKWGLKPSKYNSLANASYIPAPTISELVLDTTNSPNPTTANTYTIGLGARVDYEKAVGTYTNTYILQAVGNQISYQISYSDTTSDASVADIPSADGYNNVEVAGFTLSSTTPTRTGYTFAGWCDGTVTHVASGNSTCAPNTTTGAPGTTYAAGASYTFNSLSSSSTNLATLYAMWNVKTYSLTANFTANTGVQSVKVCTVAGNCSGSNLKGTISATGGSVPNLPYGATYYLYPSFDNNHIFLSWAKTSSTGTLSSTTALNPTFTMGLGNGTVTITGLLTLYGKVATMSKGTQTRAEVQAALTAPTSSVTISPNSGVYEYNTSVFGNANDGASTHKIYYYRGILDSYGNTGTRGSDGKADAYPNYVKLGNTCWRIVRTTGSGGVKMIYNGLYGATTANSCANKTSAAQLSATSAFDTTADSSGKSIVGIGYTYNAAYKSTTATTTAGVLFGTNSSDSNTTNSTIKTNIDNWYNSSTLKTNYGSHLEGSAGFCNDRSTYTTSSTTWSDSTSITTPYTSGSSATTFLFGGDRRNWMTAYGAITLGCPRNVVDLYTTSSATNGNKRLTNPIALLTVDESSFAGSGAMNAEGSSYHANSFLNSGPNFWLLSPNRRSSEGNANVFFLTSYGDLNRYKVSDTYGVRPAISLAQGAKIASGNGTATSPWTVSW